MWRGWRPYWRVTGYGGGEYGQPALCLGAAGGDGCGEGDHVRRRRPVYRRGCGEHDAGAVCDGEGFACVYRQSEIFDSTIGWRFVNKRLAEAYHPYSMGETAENVAKKWE